MNRDRPPLIDTWQGRNGLCAMVTEGYHRGANLALIGYQHKIAAQALADRLGLGTVRYVTTTGQDVQTWEVAQRR